MENELVNEGIYVSKVMPVIQSWFLISLDHNAMIPLASSARSYPTRTSMKKLLPKSYTNPHPNDLTPFSTDSNNLNNPNLAIRFTVLPKAPTPPLTSLRI